MRIEKPLAAAAIIVSILTLTAVQSTALSQTTQAPAPAPSANNPAAPAPPPPAPPPSPPPSPPAAVTILPNHEVQGILGRDVLSSTGENMGRIVDVVVEHSGQVRAAIIDFGGFLGVGSRKIAVEWSAIHFPSPAQTDAKISLELTRDQVKAAPEYQDGKPAVVLGAQGKLEPLPFQ
jgi:sporulation protein YlmC with PRC-barrel domain